MRAKAPPWLPGAAIRSPRQASPSTPTGWSRDTSRRLDMAANPSRTSSSPSSSCSANSAAVGARPRRWCRREDRGGSLQPRLAGLPPRRGGQADPGGSPGRRSGLGRREAQASADTTPREAAVSTSEDRTSGASGMAEQQAAGLLGGALREGYADVGDQRLHYVEAGQGPLIVLLHGFPEFWYGWRLQLKPLTAAGFRVVAPDLRGYNLSSKPDGVAAYDTGPLAADIRGLIQERGAESALLVGHDWGGTVAWATAMHHPEVVDRLAILNAAHPRKLSQGLHHP